MSNMSRERKSPVGRVERTGKTLPKKPRGELVNATPEQRAEYEAKQQGKGQYRLLPRFKKRGKPQANTENKT